MKDIQQLIKKNSQEGRYEDIFPKTFIDAVEDRESGNNLTEILSGFNMYFLSYNGSREQTRLQVPMSIRKTGLWITYVLYDKTVVTEWYAGEAIDDNSWKNLSNWRVGSNMLVGDISISSDGYWVVNGVVTTTKTQGEQGITPMLRVGSNNHLQVSYTNGSSWADASTSPVYTQFRINNNKLEQSVDLGQTWAVVSDYIASWFRFTGTSGSSQADNVGKIQISRDNGTTWSDLSGEFTNSLHIKGYVATVATLPSSAVQGDIYGVGPTYDPSDAEQINPIYQLYVKDSTGWVNNGRFTSISAGVVQEFGNSKTEVVSQKMVTTLVGFDTYNAFFTGRDYSIGEVVRHLGRLYIFTSEHIAGEWTGTDVKEISLREAERNEMLRLNAENNIFFKDPFPIIREVYIIGNKKSGVEYQMQVFSGALQVNVILYEKGKKVTEANLLCQALVGTTNKNTDSTFVVMEERNNSGFTGIVCIRNTEINNTSYIYGNVTDAAFDLNNCPLIKFWKDNNTFSENLKYINTKFDRPQSIYINPTYSGHFIADGVVKELYIAKFNKQYPIIFGNLRKNYTATASPTHRNRIILFYYHTDKPTVQYRAGWWWQTEDVPDEPMIIEITGDDFLAYALVDFSSMENDSEAFVRINPNDELDINKLSHIENSPIIYSYLKSKEGDISGQIINLKNKPAIAWVDDDFREDAYPSIKELCDNVGIKCSFALIPKTDSNYDNYNFPSDVLSKVRELENEGFHFELHPPHAGWYSGGTAGGYKGVPWVEQSLVKTKRVFDENNILHSNILIYPGSSGTNQEVVDMAKSWIDYGITASGTYNNGITNSHWNLSRLFINLSSSRTKTYFKNLILEGVNSGSLIIIGTHSWQFFEDTTTIDETTNSIPNLKEIIEYANNLCNIKPLIQVLRDRNLMFNLDI